MATPDRLAGVLQRTSAEAAEALEWAAECRVGQHPLLVRLKDVWVLSKAAIAVVEGGPDRDALRAKGLLAYRRPAEPKKVVLAWLSAHDRITSGDYAQLSGLTQQGALKHLERLVSEGFLVRGEGRGRNAHFLPGSVAADRR